MAEVETAVVAPARASTRTTVKIELPTEPCIVCAEDYHRIKRRPITCQYCSTTVCAHCVKHYLLDTTLDPHCLNCRREWDREFIDSVLTNEFRSKQLKEHRENILLDRERSLLPATQPIAEEIMRGRKMRRALIPPLEEQQRLIYREITALRDKIDTINKQIYDINREADRLEGRRTQSMSDVPAERKQFIRGCPVADCRGFLSTAWKCGMCETWVCPDCHEIKGKERDAVHTCKPEDLETVKLLAADTKPCPKCAAMITKVDGCDQMWCTQCQTAFSWRTGKIETGIVHNPHYYQWQRNGGTVARRDGEGGCGALPGYHDLRSFMRDTNEPDLRSKGNLIEAIHQRVNDMINRVLRGMPAENAVEDNSDLRIQYLLKELTDVDAWKRELQRREKKREKEHSIRRIIEMFTVVAADLLHRILQSRTSVGRPDVDAVKNIMGELEELRKYFNQQMATVGKRFGCVTPSISESWVGVGMR